MITISFVLQVVSLILLALASLNVTTSRVSLFPAGMFFWLLSLMLGAVAIHPVH
jgi:hypothetical protein